MRIWRARWAAGGPIAPGYRVLALLHRTENLDVYDVWSEERASRCVAKVVNPNLGDHPRSRRHLVGEGRLLLGLSHPHIVRAYELIERDEPVLILETLTGATLQYLIAGRRQRFPLVGLVCLGLHLASAMYYLHRRGYLHLDLKPSNIISDRGLAKVIDFSIARPLGVARRGIGTRHYMAPEQARGDTLTAAADAWGIGALLYEAATGRAPFRAYRGARYEQLERRAAPVRATRRLPAALAATIDACLDPEAAARPTIEELLATLARYASVKAG